MRSLRYVCYHGYHGYQEFWLLCNGMKMKFNIQSNDLSHSMRFKQACQDIFYDVGYAKSKAHPFFETVTYFLS